MDRLCGRNSAGYGSSPSKLLGYWQGGMGSQYFFECNSFCSNIALVPAYQWLEIIIDGDRRREFTVAAHWKDDKTIFFSPAFGARKRRFMSAFYDEFRMKVKRATWGECARDVTPTISSRRRPRGSTTWHIKCLAHKSFRISTRVKSHYMKHRFKLTEHRFTSIALACDSKAHYHEMGNAGIHYARRAFLSGWLLLTSSYATRRPRRQHRDSAIALQCYDDDVTNFSCLIGLHCRHISKNARLGKSKRISRSLASLKLRFTVIGNHSLG